MKKLLLLIFLLPIFANAQTWIGGGTSQAQFGIGYTNIRFGFGAHPLIPVYTSGQVDSLFLNVPFGSLADSNANAASKIWVKQFAAANTTYFSNQFFTGLGSPLYPITLQHVLVTDTSIVQHQITTITSATGVSALTFTGNFTPTNNNETFSTLTLNANYTAGGHTGGGATALQVNGVSNFAAAAYHSAAVVGNIFQTNFSATPTVNLITIADTVGSAIATFRTNDHRTTLLGPVALPGVSAGTAVSAYGVDGSGKMVTFSASGGGLTTANNGLSVTGTTAQLGGNLIQNTYVANSGFSHSVDSLYANVTANHHTISGTLVVIGTSIEIPTGVNVGLQTGGTGWPTLVANAMGLTLVDLAVSGSSVEHRTPYSLPSGFDFIAREGTYPSYGSTTGPNKYLVIAVGPNDWYANSANYNPTNYTTDLTSLITYIHSTLGWPYANIYVVGNSYVNPSLYGSLSEATYIAFNTATATVASSLGVAYYNVFAAFHDGGNVQLLSDLLHPNNQGHALEANGVLQFVQPPTTYKAAQSIAGQSAQFASINNVGNSILPLSKATIVGRDSVGNYGNLTTLPNNIDAGASFYVNQLLSTNLYTAGIVGAGVTMGPNDWILGSNTGTQAIYGTNNALTSYWSQLILLNTGGGATFTIGNYSNANAPIITFSAPGGSGATILQNGTIQASNISINNNLGSTIGGLTSQYGNIAVGDISGRTYIQNTYANGFISLQTTYGSGATPYEVMRMTKLGNVQIVPQTTETDAGFKLDNFGTSRLQGSALFGILANPGTLTGTPSTSGGSLTTGSYYAYLVALDVFGNQTFVNAEGSEPVTGPTGSIAYSWSAVTGATSYRVYVGISTNGENAYISTTGTSITYTGTGTTAGTPPTVNQTGTAGITSTGNIYGVLPAYSTGGSSPVVYNTTTQRLETGSGGGGGTVTSIATSTGILGGTITSTGTLKADTTVLQTVLNFFPKADTRYYKSSNPSGYTNTSITGTPNQITASASTGAVGLSIPSTFIAPGSIQATTTVTGTQFLTGTLSYTDTNILGAFQGNANSYVQAIFQNTNAGITASTDIVLSNNLGTATTYYANLGINSSGFTGSGSFNLPSASYLSATTGDLVLGTTTSNAIHFVINNGTTDAMTIGTGGAITTGTWNGSLIGSTYGGTGVNNGSSTITIAGNLTTTGAFNTTFAASATATFTLPGASQTLASLAGTETFTNKTFTSTTDILGGVTVTLGSDATGDIHYRNSSGYLTRLGIGSTGNPLIVVSGLPAWSNLVLTNPASAATLTLVAGSTLQTTGAFTLNLTTTANSTPTFPTGSGTVPYIGSATSIGALWTFPASDISIAGTTIAGVTGTGTSLVTNAAPTITGASTLSTLVVLATANNNFSVPSAAGASSSAVAALQFGGSSASFPRVYTTGSTFTLTASAVGANFIVGAAPFATTTSGTSAVLASMVVNPATITLGTGSTVTRAANLYLNGNVITSGSGTLTNPVLNLWATGNNLINSLVQSSTLGTINASATATALQMQTGWTTTSTSAVAITTATATATATQVGASGNGFYYEFVIDNSASTSVGVITLTLGTGFTSGLNPGLTVAIGKAQRYGVQFTSTTTAVISQIL